MTQPLPLATVTASAPFLRTTDAGAVERANAELGAYLDEAPLDLPTLSAIIIAGTRAMSRSDADATVLALKDTRDMMASEREALRVELSSAKSVMLDEIRAHITSVEAQTRQLMGTMNEEVNRATSALPDSTRESVQGMLTTLLSQFGTAMVSNAAAAFDPYTENSPFHRVVSSINASVAQHTRTVDTRIGELETRLAIADARTEEREHSSLKGSDFETVLEELIGDYAAGAGLRAVSTGTSTGKLRGVKKGDFVVSEDDGTPLVVVEAKNNDGGNTIPAIHAYLDIAEPNRGVGTSVWVVKGRAQHKGVPLSMLTPSRWVVALEDETPGLLNAVLAVAVATARRARVSSDEGSQDVPAAQAYLTEALDAVEDIADIEKSVASVVSATTAITKKSTLLRAKLTKSLNAAAEALDSAARTPSLYVASDVD